jgi:hypothetical protein
VARVGGFDVVRQPERVRPLIGLTGQYAAVDEELTGHENLMLIGRPRVLFLDEPTTGLDPRSRGDVWDLVRGLVADGATVLLTTQYLDEADRLAGEIAVIDNGRVIEHGTPAALKAKVGGQTLDVRPAERAQLDAAAAIVAEAAGGSCCSRSRSAGSRRWSACWPRARQRLGPRLHADLPAHLRQQRVRADREPARLAAGLGEGQPRDPGLRRRARCCLACRPAAPSPPRCCGRRASSWSSRRWRCGPTDGTPDQRGPQAASATSRAAPVAPA